MALYFVRARRTCYDGSITCHFAINGGGRGEVATSGGIPQWMFDRMGGMNGNFGVVAQTYDEKHANNTARLLTNQGFTTVEIMPVTEDMSIIAGTVNVKHLMVW